MIQVKSLTMRYGTFTALDAVSFVAEEKKILGLLGPNGAGKTTLMRILTTYLYPTSGTAEIAGSDILKDPVGVREKIGYLPETVPLYPEMQVEAYLSFVAKARRVGREKIGERLDWVRRECGLKPVWKHKLIELSKGYRQRAGLAQALIHDPEVLILDEPTSGLDPLQIIGIRKLIQNLAKEKTIVFSTHILQEVEALADRVVIINDGKIIADGTVEMLTRKALDLQRVRLAVLGERSEIEKALHGPGICDAIEYLGSADAGVHRFLLKSRSRESLAARIDALAKKAQWPLRELAEEGASLEEAFIGLLASGKAGEKLS